MLPPPRCLSLRKRSSSALQQIARFMRGQLRRRCVGKVVARPPQRVDRPVLVGAPPARHARPVRVLEHEAQEADVPPARWTRWAWLAF
jgi:hypothetical protein